jgi:hypothetical protein
MYCTWCHNEPTSRYPHRANFKSYQMMYCTWCHRKPTTWYLHHANLQILSDGALYMVSLQTNDFVSPPCKPSNRIYMYLCFIWTIQKIIFVFLALLAVHCGHIGLNVHVYIIQCDVMRSPIRISDFPITGRGPYLFSGSKFPIFRSMLKCKTNKTLKSILIYIFTILSMPVVDHCVVWVHRRYDLCRKEIIWK